MRNLSLNSAVLFFGVLKSWTKHSALRRTAANQLTAVPNRRTFHMYILLLTSATFSSAVDWNCNEMNCVCVIRKTSASQILPTEKHPVTNTKYCTDASPAFTCNTPRQPYASAIFTYCFLIVSNSWDAIVRVLLQKWKKEMKVFYYSIILMVIIEGMSVPSDT